MQNPPSCATADPSELTIHFFTIVLNGQPFIRYHIDVFQALNVRWHWHVVEGVAALQHDTAWSLALGGRITSDMHCNGFSKDGTTEYLDSLAQRYPGQITLYRKPSGQFWDGKREMVNAPLTNISEECLLWQIDADELWTATQICKARQMFVNAPERNAAYYWCHFFVGERLVVSSHNCYSQNPGSEWSRTWRYRPGQIWATHEPPKLTEVAGQADCPFLHHETEAEGLVFQHYAYATLEQLQFKRDYYGYQDAVEGWMRLQVQSSYPVALANFFSWVQDGTMIDTVEARGVVPLMHRQWTAQAQPRRARFIVDGVFFQYQSSGIARYWRSVLEEWVTSGFAQQIILIDRAGTAPDIEGIARHPMPAYVPGMAAIDRPQLQRVCDEYQAELFISTYFTTPLITPAAVIVYDMIPEVLQWDLNIPMWQEKREAIRKASTLIAISKNTTEDLARFFPQVDRRTIALALGGVTSSLKPATADQVADFRTRHRLQRPYFLVIGAADPYKNAGLFLAAFARLPNYQEIDILFTGTSARLQPVLQGNLPPGIRYHILQLSEVDLCSAYTGALALVYPSRYEGFGLPILEAMACGCPVITCPTASIPEVAGEAALYVNPDDVGGLVDALQQVQNKAVRQRLIEAGSKRVSQFLWSNTARTIAAVMVETAQKSVASDELLLQIRHSLEQGDLLAAATACYLLLESRPTEVEALYQYALILEKLGLTRAPLRLLEQAVYLRPDHLAARNLLEQKQRELGESRPLPPLPVLDLERTFQMAQEYLRNSQPQSARSLCEQLLAQTPDVGEVMRCLGNALIQLGEWQTAVDHLQRAAERLPVTPGLLFELGIAQLNSEAYAAALKTFRTLLTLQPDLADVHYNLGTTLRRLGQFEEASLAYKQALQRKPDWAAAHFFHASVLEALGRPVEAMIGYRTACILEEKPEAHYRLGLLLQTQNRLSEAVESFKCALRLQPDWIEALTALGELLVEGKKLPEGIAALTSYRIPRSDFSGEDSLLELLNQNPAKVVTYYRSIGRVPLTLYAALFTLLGLHHLEDLSPEEVYQAHRQWGDSLLVQTAQQRFVHTPRTNNGRPLRIGYLSQDFRNRSVNFFLEPILTHHCRADFQIFCYSALLASPDAVTRRFQALVDGWRDIQALSDLEAAQLIYDDQIDLLVDLTGHTGYNRLAILAYKPAPVQINYLGYPDTSGLQTVDFRITDTWADPPGTVEHLYTETLLRLPQGFLCYQPSPDAPPVLPLPARTSGRITFGCFNDKSKLTKDAFALWASILRSVPNADLLLKSQNLGDEYISAIRKIFTKEGIEPTRLKISGGVASYAEHLNCYGLIDIALDPFPYNGTTTTCESLWMGVPVITLSGRTHVSRVGVSLLNAVGLSDFIAPSVEAYRALAVELAGDLERLEGLRASLRERLAASFLLNASGFTSQLESLYRQVWQQWQQVGKN
jgi:predicted O-linked N-acetylglucosamine transferase (SPINDLY family)/glycosyltransferase involved in cell wall biosynthesis